MVDHVNPTGNLATGPPQLLVATAAAQIVQTPNRPARVADTKAASARVADAQPNSPERTRTEQVSDADLALIESELQKANSHLNFQVDQASGITYFKVVDSTGQVIRQVPSEEILSMARKLRELSSHKDASGVLMDKEG